MYEVIFVSDFLQILMRRETIFVFIALGLLLICFFMFRRIIRRRLKDKLDKLEVDINTMRSVPLSYKIQKAEGLKKVNPEVAERVELCKTAFLEVSDAFERMTLLIADCDDNLSACKLKKSKFSINELDAIYTMNCQRVDKLNSELDNLLEDEIRLRDRINASKNQLRILREDYDKKHHQLALASQYLDNIFKNIEISFNDFEECMFNSKFEKANDVFTKLDADILQLSKQLSNLPTLIEHASGYIPHLLDEMTNLYQQVVEKGVYVEHLDIDNTLKSLNSSLEQDRLNLTKGDIDSASVSIDSKIEKINSLIQAMNNEAAAYDQVLALNVSAFNQFSSLENEMSGLKNVLEQYLNRYSLDKIVIDLKLYEQKMMTLGQIKEHLTSKMAFEKIPYSTLSYELQNFYNDILALKENVQNSLMTITNAKRDEDYAKEQLVKLNLLLIEINSKIRARNLEFISEQFSRDVALAYEKLSVIEGCLVVEKIDLLQINKYVSEALDFIYRLYNESNNMISSVDMIEQTIVYANRFRFESLELDSALNQAELLFKNGDFTTSLKTIVHAIEHYNPDINIQQVVGIKG